MMDALSSYAIGMLGIAALASAWAGVQRAWARCFPELTTDPDVLAIRGGCSGCVRIDACERGLEDGSCEREEEGR